MTPNIHYEKREIVGERLELKKGPIYWLGPDLTVRDSTIIISAAGRSLVPMSGQFINCTIQAKGQLKAVVWAQMTLKGCRFKASGGSGGDTPSANFMKIPPTAKHAAARNGSTQSIADAMRSSIR